MKHSRKTAKYRIIAVILSVITVFATFPLQPVFGLGDNDKSDIEDEYAVFDTISLSDLGLNETVDAPTSNGEIASLLQYASPIDTENFSRVFKFNYTPTGKKFGLQIYNKDDGKNNSLKIETSSVSLIANVPGDSTKSISKSLTRNTSYNVEFGMKKVVSGERAGKMYMYVKIDGELLLENYSSDITELAFTGIYGFNSTLSNVNTQKTVTFMANGSEYCDAQTVNRGQVVGEEPITPINYENPSLGFLGWFKEDSVTPWNFSSDKIFEDTTLFARFEGDILTVSFDVNGGEPEVGDVSVLKGGKLTEPASPAKAGYEFSGWFAENSDKPFDFGKNVDSSIKLTAKWLKIEYSDYDVITIRDLGLGEQVIIPDTEGTVGEKLIYENPSDTETYSRVFKFKMIPPNAKYSTQVYFARNYWGNRLVIASGVCYVITKVPVEETLQALYKFEAGKEYDFEYGMIRILNGKNAGKMRLYLKINGEQLIETVAADTENLSYTGIYGQGLTLKSVDTPLNITYKVGENIYSSDTANRGSLLTEPAEPTSQDITKPAFFGWYHNGERWQFGSNKVFRNVTLTAKFVSSAYKVTFDSDGGYYTPDIQRIESGKTVTKPETPPQKEGMDFAYWQNTATQQEFDFNSIITGNVTLKAVYTLKKYTVTFRAFGKQVGTASYTVDNTEVTEPKVPAVNGAKGKWSSYTLDGGNKVSVAIYDGVSATSDGKIELSTYGDITIDVRNTLTRVLLDIADFFGLKKIISAEFDKSDRVFYDSQSIEFKWSDSSASRKYSVLFADNKEFINSYVVETTEKVLTDTVGIFIPGKTYYWKVCGSSGSVSEVDSFVISDEPCRWISSGAVTNMRDGGGWETADGKRIKYGMVYRSGSYDEPAADWSYLDETAQYVFDYLAIKSEIELRADVNHGAPVFKEDGNYLHINGGAYETLFDKGVQREYKKIFEFLADENNYPLIYHCSAGADRTGTLAYVLNGFLGVDLEDLYRDYELTSLARPGLRLRDTALSASSMEEITKKMQKDYGVQGGTFADAVENYLVNACEIAPETLEKIKTLLLEDFTPTADKVYYNVDFMVKGEKYVTQRIAEGKKAHELLPTLAIDEISLYWSTSENGEKYDFSKPIKKNTTLYLVTEKLTLEEAEELSLVDLGINGEFKPNGQSMYEYKSQTGKESRIFKFSYIPDGAFDLQIGFNGWSNRLWIPGANEIYVLQEDNRSSHAAVDSFQKGQSYEMEFAIQKVLSGTKKGQYVLYLKVDGKLTNFYYSTVGNNPFSILFYGTGHSILKNVNIPVTATFKNNDFVYKTVECSKGGLIPSFTNPTAPADLYFAGWFESGKNYAWNFDFDRISKSTTFTSKFTSKLYTVTFDSKGGTFNGSQSVKVGDGFAVNKPTDPEKEGYYFDGWYAGGREFDFNTAIKSDMVLTAKWTKDAYEDCDIISLNDIGIYDEYTVKDTFMQSYVSTTGKESRIFKFNYTPLNNPQLFVGFNGWDNRIWLTQGNEVVLAQDDTHTLIKPYTFETDRTYAVEYGMKKVISGKNIDKYYLYLKIDDTLVGEYLSEKGDNPHQIMLYGTGTADISEYPVPVEVTFNANGSVYTTQTVNRSNLLEAPAEPKSKDSTKPYFLAWMNGSAEWDFAESKVYKDITLTAKFVKSVNYVTFDYDCSDYQNVKQRIEGGTKVAKPKAPNRKGYEFVGWYNGSDKFDFNTAVKSNIVLKAKWEKPKYEECDIISLNELGIYDDKYTVAGENHYTYISATGKESRILKFAYIPSKGSDIQIGFNNWTNRLWLTNVNDLYLIAEDGKAAGTSYPFEMGKEYSVEYGMKKILNGVNKGKFYLYVSIDGKLVNEYISAIGSNPHEILMYSETNPVLKNVSVPAMITYEDCDIISLNDLGIYDNKYTVAGVNNYTYTSATGKESRIFKFGYIPSKGSDIQIGFNNWTNRLWLTNVNDLYLIAEDGKATGTSYPFEMGKEYSVEYGMKKIMSGVSKGKYYLYVSVDGKPVIKHISDIGSNPHEILMYSETNPVLKNVSVPVKITFKANGSVYTTQTVNRSNSLKAPAEPKSKDASKPYFLAWMYGSGKWDFAKDRAYKNVTLTAKFVKSVNYVTFDYDCSDYKNIKEKIETGTKIAQPKAPTRSGYTFMGWYSGGNRFNFNSAIKSNIVLKAKWEKIKYEECDIISLNDLGIYDKNFVVDKDSYYTYTSTTAKESRIFKFNYVPAKGSHVQIGFNGWNNRLWLTNVNDLYLIEEDGKAAGTSYPFEMGKEYSVEYGMKKILNGTNKGKYYLYVSIDGKLVNEYISGIGSNPQGVLFYGENKPVLKNTFVPVKITYMVGSKVYTTQTVMRSGLSTEPAKPKSTDSSKPDFYGWKKKGSTEPVNFYTERFYEDTVLTAEFAKDVHEVTFMDDGKVVKFFRTKGDTVIEEFEPENRFMQDYIWYNGSKPFDFTKEVTQDITLTTKWIDIELENYDILSLYDLGIEGDYSGYHNSESFTPTYSKSNTTYSKIFRVKVNMQDYRNFWVLFDDWGLKRFWMCADNIPNSASYVGLNSEWGYISLMFLDCELNRDYLMEFGLIRVKTGRNAGKDLIFVRIDGKVAAFSYTDELVDYGEAKYIDKKIYLRTETVTFKNVDNFCNVVFKENGKEIASARVRRSETLYAWSLLDEKNILPRDPEVPKDKREAGMTFAGWYDQDKERFDINSDSVMKDMVLEPQFGYTVTFDTGEKKKVFNVPAGWCVDEIEAPAKSGYRFDNWMLGDKKYDFSTPVNGNIVIKAKYIKTFVVKFMAGDDVYRTYEVDKGRCVNKPKQTPDPYDFELDDTYVFNCWLLNGKKFDFDTKILSDTVLKASFISKSELARIELLKKVAPFGGAVVFIGLAVICLLIFKRKRDKKNG